MESKNYDVKSEEGRCLSLSKLVRGVAFTVVPVQDNKGDQDLYQHQDQDGRPLPLLFGRVGLFSQPAIFSLPEEDGTQLCRTCLGRKRHREIEESLSTLLTFIHLGLSIQKINILHNHHKRRLHES